MDERERIIEAGRNADLSDYEIVYALACYEDFDFTVDEVLEMIENEYITTSSWNSHYIENNQWSVEAFVYDDYDEAYAAAKEDCENLIDEIGFEGINVDLAEFADEDWFKDALVESFRFYCEDIASESDDTYGNRLVEECYSRGLIDDSDFATDEDGEPKYDECLVDEDDLVERYVDWYEEDNYDWVQLYLDELGSENFDYAVKNNPSIIDIDALCEYIVDNDGVGNSLAGYDGNEWEVEYDGTTYYVYRNN